MSTVPIVTSLEDVYTQVEKQKPRYDTIASHFNSEYNLQPQYYARAPGRVNLIGEHIDYSGYGVLPMALEKDVIIASVLLPRMVNLCSNTLPKEYTTKVVSVTINNNPSSAFDNLNIDPKAHHWTNYVLCGVKGVLQHIKNLNDTSFKSSDLSGKTLDLYLLLDGDVPSGSGLSSSSAVVCASSLTTSHALGYSKEITKEQFGSLTAKSEQFVGVQSGGMDQAISFLGQRNQAMYIQFEPTLSASPVSLPEDVSFVVSHTMVSSLKSQTAAKNYNRRVVECRLACVLLHKALTQEPLLEGPRTLKWLQEKLNSTFEDMIAACEKHLSKEPYSMQQIAESIGLKDSDELQSRFFPSVDLHDKSNLKLQDRSIHVFSESYRVIQVEELCNKNKGDNKSEKIGQLMNESHYSGRDLYEASCPELEQLTTLCRSTKGCLGSRFTGAGWGGCAVSCVKKENLNEFLDTVWEQYYAKEHGGSKRENVLFASQPSAGAAIIE
ncbi:N-acetylgalactosamine kinase [Acrasis kona]|uniref:N-acetylgalactosamine kinase n=1 Tax=Acrasis kona TaxID=1008807 RepID=A0AAW2ZEI8_9EUKA